MSKRIGKTRDSIKVLIVDPISEDRKKVHNAFVRIGVTVLSTDTMEKAIKINKEEQPTIIISEYLLGEYNTGVDLVRKIKKSEDNNARTPFVLHTGMKNLSVLEQAEMNGVDKYFIKPLDEEGIKKLIRTVKRLIKSYYFS